MTSPTFPPPDPGRRGAIVLVHGAWVGEWCWDTIIARLRSRGLAVHAVSLTGLGTRRHQGGPHVTLSDHVDDLVAVLEVHDLVDATIVAHSYGGRVLTKAWPRIAHRAHHLVYLDAHAPVGSPQPAELLLEGLDVRDGGMVSIAGFEPRPDVVGGEDALSWFLDRVAPQSSATLVEPFWTDLPVELRKTYVRASANRDGRFDAYATGARERPDWSYLEIAGDHWLLFTHPDEIVDAVVRHDDRALSEEVLT